MAVHMCEEDGQREAALKNGHLQESAQASRERM